MTALSSDAAQYIQQYHQERMNSVDFLKRNSVWSVSTSNEIVLWAFQSQDTDLLEHIVQTVPTENVELVLNNLFEHREAMDKVGGWAHHLVQTHAPQMDTLLAACSRYLDAQWMLLLAPCASDAAAVKAYGTVLHYATPQVMGMDMWGKRMTNQFFDAEVQQLLVTTVSTDPNRHVRWEMVVAQHQARCELSQYITSMLQNQRLHHGIDGTTHITVARKI